MNPIATTSITKNILMIGNGFDLARGLPTKYNNFIDFMSFIKLLFTNPSSSKICFMRGFYAKHINLGSSLEVLFDDIYYNEIVFDLKNNDSHNWDNTYRHDLRKNIQDKNIDLINDKLFNKNNFLKIKKYYNTNEIKINLDNFKIEKFYKNFIKNKQHLDIEFSEQILKYKSIFDNEWLNYFINLKSNNDWLWLDFEKEVKNILEEIQYFLNSQNIDLNRGTNFENFKNTLNSSKIHNFFKFIFDERKDGTWLNSGEFFLKETKNSIKLNVNLILKYLFESFDFFCFIIKTYFYEIIEKLIGNIKEDSINSAVLDLNFEKIYSFNYTNFPDYIKSNQKYFLHGKCFESESIVLGINIDDIIIKNSEFIFFTKQHQTLSYISDNFDTTVLKNDPFHFYIWGHSLCESDKMYLDQVFNLLDNSNNLKLTIYFHNTTAKAEYYSKLIQYYTYPKIMKLVHAKLINFEKSPSFFKELNDQYQ